MAKEEPKQVPASRQLLDQTRTLLDAQGFDELRRILAEARSSDVAEVIEVIDDPARQILFDLMEAKEAGEVLEKIDEATRSEVVEDLSNDELGDILETLPPDEAADVVGDMTEEQTGQVLDQLDKEDSEQIEQLLQYEEDTAGGIMTPDLVRVNERDSVADALETIRLADPEEDFFCVFVVNDAGVLKGSVGIRQLLRHRPDAGVTEAMDDALPTVEVDNDQEEVANIFRKNDLVVMPVVDETGRLVGRITVDDVVDVMEQEAEEDALVMAGTHPAELDTPRVFRAAGVRLPWLLTCLLGSMVSLVIIHLFSSEFSYGQLCGIMLFMPAIAAMGGNSGLQTSTIVIRGLATGDLAALRIGQVFARESRVALVVAVCCAGIAGLVATLVLRGRSAELARSNEAGALAVAVGLAMFCGIMIATSLGLALPFVFRKIGVDPAISSGPLVTTANDTISYLIYFSLALALLRAFG